MFRIMKFVDRLVTREITYPFDVIVRDGPTIVLVVEGFFTPPRTIALKGFYREWAYSDNWHIVHIPGQTRIELACEYHVNANGEIL